MLALPRRRSHRSSHRSRGLTLVETLIVLIIATMVASVSFQEMKRHVEATQASMVGQEMKIVGGAMDNYISMRYGVISTLTNSTGTVSDPGPRTCNAGTSTCTITVQTLVNEGLLPSNYQSLNSYGSSYSLVLSVSGTSPNWEVNGVVTTAKPWTVGTLVRYDLLGLSMQAAGPDSGMTHTAANQLVGYGGIWSELGSTYSNINQLGLLGFRTGYGSDLYSVYLRRDGTLPMTGDLNMYDGTNYHSIDGAENITGVGTLTMNAVVSNTTLSVGTDATIGNDLSITDGDVNVQNSDGTPSLTLGDQGLMGVNSTGQLYTLANGGLVSSNASGDALAPVNGSNFVASAGNGLTIGEVNFYGDNSGNAAIESNGLAIENQAGTAAGNISEVNNIDETGTLSLNSSASTCSLNQVQITPSGGTNNALFVCNKKGHFVGVSTLVGNLTTDIKSLNLGNGGTMAIPACVSGGSDWYQVIPESFETNYTLANPIVGAKFTLNTSGSNYVLSIIDVYADGTTSADTMGLQAEMQAGCVFANDQ